jgi:hypothetical protein
MKEENMHRMLLTAAAAIALLATAAPRAEAIPLGALKTMPLGDADLVQKAATCFYPDGWHGPGFYRCGYRLRAGEGWIREREEHRERERGERREDRREDRDHHGDYGR